MLRRILVRALLAYAVVMLPARAGETIPIAFLGGLSGPYALQDEEMYKGVQMAVDIVNTTGRLAGGGRFEVVALDHKANPQDALIVLKQALDQNIRYIISGRSNIALAIADALAKFNSRNPDRAAVFLNYTGLDPALTESRCSFWHFRFSPHSDTLARFLTDQLAKQSIHKVYLINQDYAYGQSFAKAARERLAEAYPVIQVVGDDLIPLQKIKDFAPYVAKIRATGAESVLTGNWGSDLTLLIKAANEMGLKAVFYTIAAGNPGTPTAIGAAGADRVRTSASWHINAADPAWQKTLVDYRKRYNAITHLDNLLPIRPVLMLADAIGKAGSTDPLKVALALEGLPFAGPSGMSWMRAEDHQLVAPIMMLSLHKAGQPGVMFDEEGMGFGWKTDMRAEARENVPPLRCQMERPAR